MGEFHDASATMYGDAILSKIRNADADFKQVFSTSLIRTGDWDWPRPDYVCYDEELGATYALEFKPPFQSKREYLTGLGQSLAYLQKHTYSGLIVPYLADDGFRIADFIADTLKSPEFSQIATSLYAYNYNTTNIDILRGISQERNIRRNAKTDDVKTFWCWWRDISHYELYDLLNLSFYYSDHEGDIYTNHIYPTFYNMMINKQTRQWDGKPRSKSATVASMKSEKQNYKIPLVKLGLWSSSEGRLTDTGFKLLELGKKYTPESKVFFDALAYLILVDGKHLDLINLVEKFQKSNGIPEKSEEYLIALEGFLSDNGCIGKRKPSAVTTGAKNSYVRDEPKIWNKLGLLEHRGKSNYFFPEEGYKFNWERISDILVSGNKL